MWRDVGYSDVRAWSERGIYPGVKSEKVRFDVRTNLINGLPPSLV